jgi:hypothetical protein
MARTVTFPHDFFRQPTRVEEWSRIRADLEAGIPIPEAPHAVRVTTSVMAELPDDKSAVIRPVDSTYHPVDLFKEIQDWCQRNQIKISAEEAPVTVRYTAISGKLARRKWRLLVIHFNTVSEMRACQAVFAEIY